MNTFKKYLLLSLIVALVNAVILVVFFVPRFDHTDTREYIATIEYISGNPKGRLFIHRFLKPLPILIGAAISPILRTENTLIVQNLIFYFLSVLLIFFLIYRLYRNERQAFYGVILYIGAYPMLAYGLAPLTDMPGWFFYLFSVFIALAYFKRPNLKTSFLSGLVAGIGMLFKENSAAASIFFVSLLIIVSQVSLKDKLKNIFVFGIAFLFFPLINQLYIYSLYSYSYWDWYRTGGLHSTSLTTFYAYTPFRIIIEMGRVFLIGWIFFLGGFFKEIYIKNRERQKVLLSFIPSSLSFFLWAYPHNRIIFIAAPLLVLLGSFGLLRKHKNSKVSSFVEVSLLSLYIFVNYIILEFLLRYGTIIQPPGTIFG